MGREISHTAVVMICSGPDADADAWEIDAVCTVAAGSHRLKGGSPSCRSRRASLVVSLWVGYAHRRHLLHKVDQVLRHHGLKCCWGETVDALPDSLARRGNSHMHTYLTTRRLLHRGFRQNTNRAAGCACRSRGTLARWLSRPFAQLLRHRGGPRGQRAEVVPSFIWWREERTPWHRVPLDDAGASSVPEATQRARRPRSKKSNGAATIALALDLKQQILANLYPLAEKGDRGRRVQKPGTRNTTSIQPTCPVGLPAGVRVRVAREPSGKTSGCTQKAPAG